MTVHVPGSSVIVRKPRWKQLLLPEIPASRLACLTSGSFRPKLGLGILVLLALGCIVLVIVPLIVTPTITSLVVTSAKAVTKMEPFNKELSEVVVSTSEKFHRGLFSVVKNASQNQIMSSYSVSSVLGMILHGASGTTATEMRKSLGLLDDAAFEKFTQNYKMVANQLKSNENFTLNSANRVYFAQDNTLDEKYLTSTKDNFLAEPVATDFGNEEVARTTINKWVEEQTNSKIKDLIARNVLNSLTKLVLVNAIHFKGDWEMKFDKENTHKGDFHVSKDKTVQADMMFINQKFPYLPIKELKAEALEMPYKGQRLAMVILLPKPESSLEELESAVAQVPDINELLKFPRPGRSKVEVTLPKFKLESEIDLKENLEALGMSEMFSDNADFSAMTGGVNKGLYVSKVIQKAFIEVNEEGAEAAAATAGIMMMRAMVIVPRFTCDRPFMFMIRDNLTGITLFSGHVTDPTASSL